MATTTSRLGLRKPAETELVNVATDLDANFDAIDAAVGIAVTTALPTNPYAGKAVAISTDGYRSYFSNGTTPASSSWVELLNSSGTFGSDIKLAAGKKLLIGADVNLYRSAANILATDDSLTVAGGLTVGSDVSLTKQAAAPASPAAGSMRVHGRTNGGLYVKDDTGNTALLASPAVQSESHSVLSISNSTAETVLGTLTIPANDAQAGSVYELFAAGGWNTTGLGTVTVRVRLGGLTGTVIATLTAADNTLTGYTNAGVTWRAVLTCASTGVSGTWYANCAMVSRALDLVSRNPSVVGSTTPATRDTTVAQDFVITFQFNTASASNALDVFQRYGQKLMG